VPGRVNGFDVIVEQPGTYQGQCAELCGLSHADMFMSLTAEDRAATKPVCGAGRDRQRVSTPAPSRGRPAAVGRPAPGWRHRPGQRFQRGRFRPDRAVRAGQRAITIQFANDDPSVVHNVSTKGGLPDGKDFIGLPLAAANTKVEYQAPPLAAGTYTFFCSVHANMTGTLTVQ
jgi:hypothetical protein